MKAQADRIMSILRRVAPKIPLDEALSLATEFQSNFDEMMLAAEALAVLSESVLGYDSREGFGDKYKDARPAVRLALEHVGYRHAWVVCGPVADGMERLLTLWDDKAIAKARGET